jgi:hypothetical protein
MSAFSTIIVCVANSSEHEMQQNKVILPADDERSAILQSVGLNSEEPLLITIEAMIAHARQVRETHPMWHPLGARIGEGIATARDALEAHGGWGRHITQNRLEGVRHIETGRFLAIHNTCERTGLSKGLPRFASPRSRSATKSLRDDLQGDFCELIEGFEPSDVDDDAVNNLTMHLCVFILREALETGEDFITARAELVIGAVCSDLGIKGCQYRLPLDLDGMTGSARDAEGTAPRDGGAVEAEISIRRKR